MQTLTHTFSARFKAPKLVYYVNVYRDEKGETHYSPEEFGTDQEGVHSYEDALYEAFRLTQRSPARKWSYVTTLTNVGADVQEKIQADLEELERLLHKLKLAGMPTAHIVTPEDVYSEAEELAA